MSVSVNAQPDVTTPVVLTEHEVARVLRVTDRTIRRWVDTGTLNVIKVGGVRRYRLRDVVALIDPSTAQDSAEDEALPQAEGDPAELLLSTHKDGEPAATRAPATTSASSGGLVEPE